MSQIQTTARFRIREGRLAEFQDIAARCMHSVRTKDTGTLQYDWFFNADQTECVVREMYRDSAAVLEHVANLADTLGALLSVADLEVEVFGSPSEELLQATRALAPRVYSPFQSIQAVAFSRE
jgi:quinol monooxygenase YgiN